VSDRLYRSSSDRVISGVAGGLAVWLNLDPSLVRVAWVLLTIVSGGVFLLVYIVMMIVVPEPPPGLTPQPRDARPAPGDPPQWTSAPAPATNVAWSNAPGIVFGLVLVLLGSWFLVRRYVDINWDIVWPFIVIGLGVLLIITAAARGRRPG
jgi:phage shock protein C